MISLNLLPDVKIEYLQAQSTKRFFISLAILISAAVLALVVLLAFFVFVLQGRHANNLKNDIQSNVVALQNEPDLSRILTVQKQLEALPGLHQGKPLTSRLFNYLTVLVPDEVDIDKIEMSLASGGDIEEAGEMVIELTGRSTDFKEVNKFADALKGAEYSSSLTVQPEKAFSDVALDSVGASQGESLFSILATIDPNIFSSEQENLKLVVPADLGQSTGGIN